MGLLDKLLKPTPLYNFYVRYKEKKVERKQQKIEAELHPLRVKFYKQFINPADLVFDVGANVGNRVLSFLDCDAKVVAVEPQPDCVQILKDKFGNKIHIENIGLSEVQGELEMHIATDSTVSSFSDDYIQTTKDRFKYSKWVDTIKVKVSTMDNLIEKYGLPKFCKIDVEGYELQVLKGLHEVIPILSIEYCVPEMHQQLTDCIEYLQQLSPNGQFNYSVGESMQWAMNSWLDFEAFKTHIATSDFIKSSFGDIYFQSN